MFLLYSNLTLLFIKFKLFFPLHFRLSCSILEQLSESCRQLAQVAGGVYHPCHAHLATPWLPMPPLPLRPNYRGHCCTHAHTHGIGHATGWWLVAGGSNSSPAGRQLISRQFKCICNLNMNYAYATCVTLCFIPCTL